MATRVEEAQNLLRESRGAMAATHRDEARVAAERGPARPGRSTDPRGLGRSGVLQRIRKSTFDARERAFRRYRDLGDDLGSARVAILIANASYDARTEIVEFSPATELAKTIEVVTRNLAAKA